MFTPDEARAIRRRKRVVITKDMAEQIEKEGAVPTLRRQVEIYRDMGLPLDTDSLTETPVTDEALKFNQRFRIAPGDLEYNAVRPRGRRRAPRERGRCRVADARPHASPPAPSSPSSSPPLALAARSQSEDEHLVERQGLKRGSKFTPWANNAGIVNDALFHYHIMHVKQVQKVRPRARGLRARALAWELGCV